MKDSARSISMSTAAQVTLTLQNFAFPLCILTHVFCNVNSGAIRLFSSTDERPTLLLLIHSNSQRRFELPSIAKKHYYSMLHYDLTPPLSNIG